MTAFVSDEAMHPYIVKPKTGNSIGRFAPDLPRDVDLPVPGVQTTEIGFASFWSASSIAPNAMYPALTRRGPDGTTVRGPDGRIDMDGGLVFQIPARNEVNTAGFYALVLIDRAHPQTILATAWFNDWGPRLDCNVF